MNIYINNFTKFSFEKINDELISKIFSIKVENKFFKFNIDSFKLEDVEIRNLIVDLERLLKDKMLEPKKLTFKDQQLGVVLFPNAFNRTILDMQLFIKNDNDVVVSDYSLTFEREDIISLYVYLCDLMNVQNFFKLPEDYKYMYLYVRYLDVNTVKQFCYISDDSSIRVGDYVLVNRKDEISVAIVEKIDFYTKETAPFPVEKTKEIIRRVERSEIKDNIENNVDDEDDSNSYVTNEEFKDLKIDLDILKSIFKNQNSNLSLKLLIRYICRQDSYLQVYYYPQLNVFISKIDNFYFLSDYERQIFSISDYKDMVNHSICVPFLSNTDIMEVYDLAINFCKSNNIDFEDDIKIEQVPIDSKFCAVDKIFVDNKLMSTDSLYMSICEQQYSNLKLYVRDMNISKSDFLLYKDNIGNVVQEKAYVDCTSKIGGLIKNTRFFIVSNSIRDLSFIEEDTNWGLCVADKDSMFKVLDASQFGDRCFIVLLHLNNNVAKFFRHINTNVDENIKSICETRFDMELKNSPRYELDGEWYSRLFFPIGIEKNGNIKLI